MKRLPGIDQAKQLVGQRQALFTFESSPAIPAFDGSKFFLLELDARRLVLTLSIKSEGQLSIDIGSFEDQRELENRSPDEWKIEAFLSAFALAGELGTSTLGLINPPKELGVHTQFLSIAKAQAESKKPAALKLLHFADDGRVDIGVPKMRTRCLNGNFHIAVTVRTFSNDPELVNALERACPNIKLNRQSDKLDGQRLIEFLSDADGAIVGMERPTRDILNQLPMLRVISKYGVGVDNIDFDAAHDFQIPVHYKKGLNTDSVAELTLGYTIMLLRRIEASMAGYREGRWNKTPGRELSEVTVGLIGYGIIGNAVAKKFLALGVQKLIVHDVAPVNVASPVELRSLEELLAESDVVSLHLSMLPGNQHLVNKSFIEKMKPGALLINTSRGEIVDEKALVEALVSGQLAGAALDVFETEPAIEKALAEAPNLITTCHIGGSSNRAIKNMGYAAMEGVLKELLFSLGA